MPEAKYMKLESKREGRAPKEILVLLREKGGKYYFMGSFGKWVEAPKLKSIFDGSHRGNDKYVPATEKEATAFVSSNKPEKDKKINVEISEESTPDEK